MSAAKPEPEWIARIAAGGAPRLRNPGESVEDYRIAMGWDKPKGAEHTPGPWRVRPARIGNDFGIVVNEPAAEGNWAVIAEVAGDIRRAGENAPEARLNALLIAASPEMLEGMRIGLIVLRNVEPSGEPKSDDVLKSTIAAFEEIIARATGAEVADHG